MRSALRWTAVLCVAVTLVLGAAPASAAPEMPPITQSLNENQACRTASTVDTNDPPWAQARLRPERAWTHTDGSGVTVAVLDTGVDATSPALSGKVQGAGKDCVGHGTFVAGIVAAAPRPGGGFSGIAPGARVLSVPVTDRTGGTTAPSLATGIRTALAAGARIVQVSAAVVEPSPELADAVAGAVAAGAVIVAPAAVAAGRKPVAAYPAAYPGVVSVAALTPQGAPMRTDLPGIRVDLAAPGAAITGPGPGGPGLFTASGDAVAAAMVSGTAALVRSYRPALSGPETARRLKETAYPPAGGIPDPLLGNGVVDPAAAVTAELPSGAATSAAAPAAVRMPAPAERGPEVLAGIVAAVAGTIIALVAIGAVVLPRARRRGWRAG
ncbi:S8 family serine peptidase [Amycolatopsis sp. NPDC059027]|uniref:S8 family serine peptidase n=1 Tax=Amycolatopsis sp. NPDC059027 TaxID=3346709 RepID=UPI0036724131